MLTRFRERLVAAAAARNIAVDLYAKHGADAAAIIEAELGRDGVGDAERAILLRARHEVRNFELIRAGGRPERYRSGG